MEKAPNDQNSYKTHKTGTQKTIAPAKGTDYGSHDDKCHRLPNIMAGTPKTIERTALLVSKPTGKADNARSSAHGLEPAADAPKNGKKNKGMHKTEEKIYQCSHKQPGGHETVDITPVG